jgi:hypothetical protein
LTRFTLDCPSCEAEVTLPVRKLMVRVEDESASAGECLFTCLMCHRSVIVPLDPMSLAALLVAGATHVVMPEASDDELDTELDTGADAEPGAVTAPPLTNDDLMDLLAELADEYWLERLRALGQHDL